MLPNDWYVWSAYSIAGLLCAGLWLQTHYERRHFLQQIQEHENTDVQNP